MILFSLFLNLIWMSVPILFGTLFFSSSSSFCSGFSVLSFFVEKQCIPVRSLSILVQKVILWNPPSFSPSGVRMRYQLRLITHFRAFPSILALLLGTPHVLDTFTSPVRSLVSKIKQASPLYGSASSFDLHDVKAFPQRINSIC